MWVVGVGVWGVTRPNGRRMGVRVGGRVGGCPYVSVAAVVAVRWVVERRRVRS